MICLITDESSINTVDISKLDLNKFSKKNLSEKYDEIQE